MLGARLTATGIETFVFAEGDAVLEEELKEVQEELAEARHEAEVQAEKVADVLADNEAAVRAAEDALGTIISHCC